MSNHISSTLPPINHNDHFDAMHHAHRNHHRRESDTAEVRSTYKTRKRNELQPQSDFTSKAFNSLTKSLTRAFTDATKVDKQTGDEEISTGGLQRVAKDLSKLFKGLGLSPQQAKQYARGISSAMGTDGVEQINFSLSTSQSLLVTGYNQSGSIESSADSLATSSQMSGYQLTAVKTQSFDVSINLSTGEFSVNHSLEESFSLTAFSGEYSEDVVSNSPLKAEDMTETEALPTDELTSVPGTEEQEEPVLEPENSEETTEAPPAEENQTVIATGSSVDALLFEFSRSMTQSAAFSTNQELISEPTGEEATEEEEVNPVLNRFQMFAESSLHMTWAEATLFESITDISNLRIEVIDQQEYLNFSVEAIVPLGLTATEEDGSSTTMYPRPDGSIGETTTEAVEISA